MPKMSLKRRERTKDTGRTIASQDHPYAHVLQRGLAITSMGSAHGAVRAVEGEPCCGLEETFGRALSISDEKGGRDRQDQGQGSGRPSIISALSSSRRSRTKGDKTQSPLLPEVASSSSSGRRGNPGARKKRVRFSREVEVRYFRKHESVRSATSTEYKADEKRRWHWR